MNNFVKNYSINNIFIQNNRYTIQYKTNLYNYYSEEYNLQSKEITKLPQIVEFNYGLYSLDRENFIYFDHNTFIRRWTNNIFILNSFELKNNKFKIQTITPVYNTDNYIITICDNNEQNFKHFLYKENKIFEIETENEYRSLTLDVLTYKMFGVFAENHDLDENVKYNILDKNEYFQQIV